MPIDTNPSTPTNTSTLVTRILDATADRIDEHSTIAGPFGYQIPACMTEGWLDLAVRRALWPALDEVRGWNRVAVQAAVKEAVRAVLPPVTGTVAEYADQLRAIANDPTTRRLTTTA